MQQLTQFAAGRRRWCVLLAAVAAGPVLGAPVGDALERPAIPVLRPQHAVLLAGAMAGPRIVAVGERGIVALSDDQGRSWRQAQVPVSVTLTAVRFADARNGLVVGHGGTVLATEDGGEHWQLRLDGRRAAQLALAAAKAGSDARAVKDAERLVADGPDKPLLDIVMTDARRALVVGAYGLAFATEDAGANWTSWMGRLDNPKALHIYAVRRAGGVIVLAGEQGLLLRSDNAGSTFRRITTPYAGSFFTVEVLPDGSMLAAGLRGNVWRADARGASWTQIKNSMPVSVTASAMRADGTVLLANQAGFVLEVLGDQLVPINPAPMPPINGLLLPPSAVALALTIQGVIPVIAGSAQGASK